jgi:hypothetical protein
MLRCVITWLSRGRGGAGAEMGAGQAAGDEWEPRERGLAEPLDCRAAAAAARRWGRPW